MHLSILLTVVLALQAAGVLQTEPAPDLRHVIRDDAELASAEISYRVDGQLIAVRGDGSVFIQSTRPQLPLLLTCKGKVVSADIRRLLETMLSAQFLYLPQKSYMMLNGDESDWRKLQLHSISIKVAGRSAKRDFAAGEYSDEHQEIPEKFTTIEKAIVELKSKAILSGTQCTVAPPL